MSISEPADSIPDYKEKRRKAEHDSDRGRPRLGSDTSLGKWSRIEAHVEIFKSGYNSIDDMNTIFSKDDFETFIQELVKDVPGIHGELVDILNPKRETFGVMHTEAHNEAWNEGRIKVADFKSPLKFISAPQPSRDERTLWYHCSEPWDALDFSEPDYSIVEGEKSPHEVNRKLAELIDERDRLDLPEEFRYLLE